MFVAGNHFHPFLETLPLTEINEKTVFAYLIEGLDLVEPLFDWYEFCGFGVDKLADTLAAESVVLVYFFLSRNDFRVGHYFHVVVVVLVFFNHINKLVGRKLLLSHHLEKSCHLLIRDLNLARLWLFGW